MIATRWGILLPVPAYLVRTWNIIYCNAYRYSSGFHEEGFYIVDYGNWASPTQSGVLYCCPVNNSDLKLYVEDNVIGVGSSEEQIEIAISAKDFILTLQNAVSPT